ncbi:hypothetical protein [Mycolicibacterium iranicum]|uniref:Uncharacterized protein n=2 Tax=Mycolicibacterium iranicum TaxID=912594 RepID=A0ABT4HK88_MYCIR|nr:hypothetical protein [Mycolicibacterium iranicum]MCZ0730383.1 hypothetical protein [Mycolicibacterium iranicum]
MKIEKLAGAKPKKKCCRSKPRCKRCPLVLHKVHKAELLGIRGKELEKVYKRARKAWSAAASGRSVVTIRVAFLEVPS